METIQLPKDIALKAFNYAFLVADESFKQRAISILDKYDSPINEPLRFLMLGRFRIFKGCDELRRECFQRTKAWRLLSFLAHHFPHRVSHEMIMEALWTDFDQQAAKKNIYTTLSSLYSTLEPSKPRNVKSAYIHHKDGLIWLESSLVEEIDTDSFDRLYKQGDVELQNNCVDAAIDCFMEINNIYRGHYLEEEVYSDWPVTTRTLFSDELLNVIEKLSTLLLQEGRVLEALSFLNKASHQNPLNERICRALVNAYQQVGMREKAHECFTRYRNLLKKELGIEPDLQTFQTYMHLYSTG
jgi:DNA-binding SARP family transcriptional activator